MKATSRDPMTCVGRLSLRDASVRTLVAMIVLGTPLGCADTSKGPNLGQVSGTVTLDGRPIRGAWLVFTPESGLSSYGRTDAGGRYQLQFTARRTGAVVGQHTVQIGTKSTASEGEGDDRPEAVPAIYNDESTLVKEVSSGDNTIDFELQSGN